MIPEKFSSSNSYKSRMEELRLKELQELLNEGADPHGIEVYTLLNSAWTFYAWGKKLEVGTKEYEEANLEWVEDLPKKGVNFFRS